MSAGRSLQSLTGPSETGALIGAVVGIITLQSLTGPSETPKGTTSNSTRWRFNPSQVRLKPRSQTVARRQRKLQSLTGPSETVHLRVRERLAHASIPHRSV